MTDEMKQAWNDVADGFSTLGRMMRERYQGAGGDETEDAGAGGGQRDAAAALREAFDRLVAAGREFGDRAAGIARDDEVRAQAKRAASSLNDALSATVDLIGEEVGGLFKRPKNADPPAEIEASSPLPAATPAEDSPPPAEG